MAGGSRSSRVALLRFAFSVVLLQSSGEFLLVSPRGTEDTPIYLIERHTTLKANQRTNPQLSNQWEIVTSVSSVEPKTLQTRYFPLIRELWIWKGQISLRDIVLFKVPGN